MDNNARRVFCLYVTGFNEDIDRIKLKTEFSKFGNIEKLFLDQLGTYAKVYYSDKSNCDEAIKALQDSSLNWKVDYTPNIYPYYQNKPQKKFSPASSTNSVKMARYSNYNEEEENFSENYEYCDVHGHPLVTMEADSGELYVNLKDVRKCGFALFRKDTFNSILMDKRQIGKEFELHLLSEAKNYMLRNKVAVIDEEQILRTIERCKNKLLGEDPENKGNFGTGRSVLSNNNRIVITAVEETPQKFPMETQTPTAQRPPKSLPNNFMPLNTNTPRNVTPKPRFHEEQRTNMNLNKEKRDYTNHVDAVADNKTRGNSFVNGFGIATKKKDNADQKLNSSNHSDTGSRKSNGSFKPSVKEEVGKLTFEIGSSYAIQVVYHEKENIYWVQEKNDGILQDMFIQLNEAEEDLQTIDPTIGQLVIAPFEGAWCRGQVIRTNPIKLHFIDYGNKAEVEEVKPLLDIFKHIKAQAARIIVHNAPELKETAELCVRVKKQYDDGTYVVDIVDVQNSSDETRAAAVPTVTATKTTVPIETKKPDPPKQEQVYFDIPKPISALQNGDVVMCIDIEANKFLVRTRECALKSKELTDYIKILDKSVLTLTNVKVGQLVLSSKDGLVGLYRAVVTKKDSGLVVTVKYIDFPGEDDLSVKSLRNVNEFLANQPATIIPSPEFKDLTNMDEKVAEYIAGICQNKMKFTVVLSGNNFDLKFDDGTLLSEKIQDLKCPKPKQTTIQKTEVKPSTSKECNPVQKEPVAKSCPATETKVLYEDMDWIKIDVGTHTFMCYCLQDICDITMISTTEEVISYLEDITDIEVVDNTPYKPDDFEMCLVSFKGPDEPTASWYRAVVLEREDDEYLVSFSDFGNKEKISYENIRRFPSHLKKVPILGINCKCIGIPDTPQILEDLKRLIPEGEQVEVVVKGLSDLVYEIEIPDVYKQLKAAGAY